jgi:hypothetical protein
VQGWDTATWISAGALLVSALSILVASWAAWISHRALGHSHAIDQRERRTSFQRERAQLLDLVNASRSVLDRTRIEIAALKATFDAESEPVRILLGNYTSLFTEYLPRIEAGVRQATALWDEVAGWNEGTDVDAIIQMQAKIRALLHEDQVAHDQGLYLVGVFREKLALARER